MKPRVTKTKHKLSAPVMAWVQSIADRAYPVQTGPYDAETEHELVCCARGAVPPHVDPAPTADLRIIGLVLRSDGHRLHSQRLHADGQITGIELHPGDFYQIDPNDRHWTTVPDDDPKAELIFSVHIMRPDGRTPAKLSHDMQWSLIAASIDAMRGAPLRSPAMQETDQAA